MVPRSTALYPEGVVGQALVLELAFQHATFALGLCDNFIYIFNNGGGAERKSVLELVTQTYFCLRHVRFQFSELSSCGQGPHFVNGQTAHR